MKSTFATPVHPALRAATLAFGCMPKLGCPLCWHAIAAVCGLFGLEFSALNPIITGAMVVTAVATLSAALRTGRFTASSTLLFASVFVMLAYRIWDLPVCVGYAGSLGILLSMAVRLRFWNGSSGAKDETKVQHCRNLQRHMECFTSIWRLQGPKGDIRREE